MSDPESSASNHMLGVPSLGAYRPATIHSSAPPALYSPLPAMSSRRQALTTPTVQPHVPSPGVSARTQQLQPRAFANTALTPAKSTAPHSFVASLPSPGPVISSTVMLTSTRRAADPVPSLLDSETYLPTASGVASTRRRDAEKPAHTLQATGVSGTAVQSLTAPMNAPTPHKPIYNTAPSLMVSPSGSAGSPIQVMTAHSMGASLPWSMGTSSARYNSTTAEAKMQSELPKVDKPTKKTILDTSVVIRSPPKPIESEVDLPIVYATRQHTASPTKHDSAQKHEPLTERPPPEATYPVTPLTMYLVPLSAGQGGAVTFAAVQPAATTASTALTSPSTTTKSVSPQRRQMISPVHHSAGTESTVPAVNAGASPGLSFSAKLELANFTQADFQNGHFDSHRTTHAQPNFDRPGHSSRIGGGRFDSSPASYAPHSAATMSPLVSRSMPVMGELGRHSTDVIGPTELVDTSTNELPRTLDHTSTYHKTLSERLTRRLVTVSSAAASLNAVDIVAIFLQMPRTHHLFARFMSLVRARKLRKTLYPYRVVMRRGLRACASLVAAVQLLARTWPACNDSMRDVASALLPSAQSDHGFLVALLSASAHLRELRGEIATTVGGMRLDSICKVAALLSTHARYVIAAIRGYLIMLDAIMYADAETKLYDESKHACRAVVIACDTLADALQAVKTIYACCQDCVALSATLSRYSDSDSVVLPPGIKFLSRVAPLLEDAAIDAGLILPECRQAAQRLSNMEKNLSDRLEFKRSISCAKPSAKPSAPWSDLQQHRIAQPDSRDPIGICDEPALVEHHPYDYQKAAQMSQESFIQKQQYAHSAAPQVLHCHELQSQQQQAITGYENSDNRATITGAALTHDIYSPHQAVTAGYPLVIHASDRQERVSVVTPPPGLLPPGILAPAGITQTTGVVDASAVHSLHVKVMKRRAPSTNFQTDAMVDHQLVAHHISTADAPNSGLLRRSPRVDISSDQYDSVSQQHTQLSSDRDDDSVHSSDHDHPLESLSRVNHDTEVDAFSYQPVNENAQIEVPVSSSEAPSQQLNHEPESNEPTEREPAPAHRNPQALQTEMKAQFSRSPEQRTMAIAMPRDMRLESSADELLVTKPANLDIVPVLARSPRGQPPPPRSTPKAAKREKPVPPPKAPTDEAQYANESTSKVRPQLTHSASQLSLGGRSERTASSGLGELSSLADSDVFSGPIPVVLGTSADENPRHRGLSDMTGDSSVFSRGESPAVPAETVLARSPPQYDASAAVPPHLRQRRAVLPSRASLRRGQVASDAWAQVAASSETAEAVAYVDATVSTAAPTTEPVPTEADGDGGSSRKLVRFAKGTLGLSSSESFAADNIKAFAMHNVHPVPTLATVQESYTSDASRHNRHELFSDMYTDASQQYSHYHEQPRVDAVFVGPRRSKPRGMLALRREAMMAAGHPS